MYGVVAYLDNDVWTAKYNELDNALGVLKELAESYGGCVIDTTTGEVLYTTVED